MSSVYINIGNSEDKLSQMGWHKYWNKVNSYLVNMLNSNVIEMHGNWQSASIDGFQNACWCIEFTPDFKHFEDMKQDLADIALEFDQEAIAWSTAETEFIATGKYMTPSNWS